ncbi:hypothetical protein ACWC10_10645 [Streptomyces sp. NPDC001595]|uniref:hypothetical protein n=1 Tax=Streptomyces sp. NPDC001532 TaxID=3154520 RepID=UPI003318919B
MTHSSPAGPSRVEPTQSSLPAPRARRVSPGLAIPLLPVAFVVARAPSEPWPTRRRSPRTAARQDHPYDHGVRRCEEGPTEETARRCRTHLARTPSRRGAADRHRAGRPRRPRCEDGDRILDRTPIGFPELRGRARERYAPVPRHDHPAGTVRPFAGPASGHGAAPSVCGAFAHGLRAARGRPSRQAAG